MPSRSNKETSRSYGTPIQPAVRVGPPANRNRVGEADPATRRRMLDEKLRPGPPVKTTPAQKSNGDALKVERAANDLRYRSGRLDDEIEKRSK